MTTARVAATIQDIISLRTRAESLYGGRGREFNEFLVRITLASSVEASPEIAFDIAHQVRDESGGRFAWVEPDIPQRPSVAFADVSPPREAEVADRAEVIGEAISDLCNEKATPPDDRFWHLRRIHAPQAWEFSVVSGAPSRGRGIRVGHLDTGWTTHPDLQPSLDLNGQFDFVDDDADAHDELANGNPFHGTRTGSVIASTFTGSLPGATAPFPGDLSGVAPEAKIVPVRVVKRVIIFFNGDVVRGIRHAADHDCHVISMSLGGIAGSTMRDAVKHAVANNVIVCAAAGNCVRIVVMPASFPETIAVAATNSNNRPWKGSSRGESVDITAPGAQVWTAARMTDADPRPIAQGEGTSFAVAGVAGVAALWLAHHGRDALIKRYGPHNVPLQFVFRHILKQTAEDIGLPANEFGAGLVNAEAVLRFAPLPDPGDISTEATAAVGAADTFDAIAGDLLTPVSPVIRHLAVSGMRSGQNAAERDLLMQEFAQICFDHPNARTAYERGLRLASASSSVVEGDVASLLDAGGIAKYASTRLRSRLAHQ